MPVGWRAQATWPTQDLVKQVKLPVATTSESSQLPLSSSSPGCSEAQPDNKWRSTKRCRSRSTANNPTKRGDPGMDERGERRQEWGREVGTQPARIPGTSREGLFFSCIAERARDIVGQLLEIRNEVKPNWMQNFHKKNPKNKTRTSREGQRSS